MGKNKVEFKGSAASPRRGTQAAKNHTAAEKRGIESRVAQATQPDGTPRRGRGRPPKPPPPRDPYGRWWKTSNADTGCKGGVPDPDDKTVCWATPADRECTITAVNRCKSLDACDTVRLGGKEANDVCAPRRIIQRARDQALARRWPRSFQSKQIPAFVRELFQGAEMLPGLPGARTRRLPRHMDENKSSPGSACAEDADSWTPTVAQMVIRQFCAAVCTRRDTGSFREAGLLAWHSVGAGKTCTAAMAIDAFWDGGLGSRNIVVVTSPTGLRANPPESFYRCLVRACPRFHRASGETVEDAIKRTETMCRARGVLFMSFTQLAHHLMLIRPTRAAKTSSPTEQRSRFRELLRNSILIADEVHALYRPNPRFAEEYRLLREFFVDRPSPHADGLFALLLTGTPGSSVAEAIEILNVVRPSGAPKIENADVDSDKFEAKLAGTVSYLNASGDRSIVPRVVQPEPTRAPMSEKQFEAYKVAAARAGEKLASAKPPRGYGNSTYRIPTDIKEDELREFSAKLPALLQTVRENPEEKHLVYTSFRGTKGEQAGQGVYSIANALTRYLGYSEFTPKDCVEEQLAPRKRFMVLTPGDVTQKALECMMRVFNSDENSRGAIVHVVLATDGFDEGINFMAVKHVHLFEPLLSYLSEKQVIGRAARFCSHKQLLVRPKQASDWTVVVHRYIGDRPTVFRAEDAVAAQASIDRLAIVLETHERTLEASKGRRGADAKTAREAARNNVKDTKRKIAEIAKRQKTIEEGLHVRLADVSVYNEARTAVASLYRLFQSIKSAAIDCLLFRDFHRSTELPVVECWGETR